MLAESSTRGLSVCSFTPSSPSTTRELLNNTALGCIRFACSALQVFAEAHHLRAARARPSDAAGAGLIATEPANALATTPAAPEAVEARDR